MVFLPWLLFSLLALGMLPMRAVRMRLGNLLADDATTLAPAVDANKVALVMSDFTPDEDMLAVDITLATFDGSTPILGATGNQEVGTDPVTGDQIITIKETAGGWRWQVTGVTHLPQVIYGYALLSNDLSTLLAITKFPEPIGLNAIGNMIDLGSATLRFVIEPIS